MKKLVIMAGLPGSGKSFVRSTRYADFQVVDCDEIKKSISGYDPKNPEAVHAESKVKEQEEIYYNLALRKSFVYDTTATNYVKLIKLIQDAKAVNYTVELCYVKVSLKTALERNSKRERVVSEYLINEKFSLLPISLNILKDYVDEFVTVDND